MPRPNKAGLDYFPLDVNLDEKIDLIEAKHGLIGFAIIIKLYQNIYRNGYYMDATEERLLLFKKKVDADINTLIDVINDACKWGVFDENNYKKYSILTSRGIQKRFIEATKRRKEVDFIKEYILFDPKNDLSECYPETVNVNIIALNVNNNPKNADIKKQSKVKESKVKNIYTVKFVTFWEKYPRKVQKQKAFEAWQKCNGERPPLDELLAILEKHKKSKDWKKDNGQFIPYPATWLNGKRWEDEISENEQPDEPSYW